MSDFHRIQSMLDAGHPLPPQVNPDASALVHERPRTWAEFFERLNMADPEREFMSCRPLNTISVDRDFFNDEAH